jgi:peptidoglycan/LPS O-acetylase OafA/YrhL
MVTRPRGGGLSRSWASPICVTWMTCVSVAAWFLGKDNLPADENADLRIGTGTYTLFLVASLLGLAFGVAMVKERRTRSVVPTVLAAALFATLASLIAIPDASAYVLLIYVEYAVVLGAPVIAGALLGATWRLVRRQLERRSTEPVSGGRPADQSADP